MFDIFYSGVKPELFAHEREADSIEHAQTMSRTRYFWWVHYLADLSQWDFLWEPPRWQAHQRHAWPSQWQKDIGVYLVPVAWDGVETNYRSDKTITAKPNADNWHIPDYVINWDTSWHPDPLDPPYLHEFGSAWHNEGGPVYQMPGAVDRKYHNRPTAEFVPTSEHWKTLTDCKFDYSWRPHPKDPPYIYVFGNQWWSAEKFATVEYHVPGATERKYMNHPKAELLSDMQGWNSRSDHRYHFDYSWKPDPGDPPMIYVFGNQWWPAEKMPTVEWSHPDITEDSDIKYVDWPRAKLLPNDTLWTVPNGLTDVDLSWVPDPGAPPYIYQFGTQHQKTGGPVYNMLGANEVHYVSRPRANKISVDPNWTIPNGVDSTSFDLTWHPDATEQPYIYQFATQHQKTGGPVYTVPGATETKYIEELKVHTTKVATAIVEIDHLDGNAGLIPNITKRVRYFDNYRDTLIRIAKSMSAEHEYIWVCSSICDYTDFDFSWHPEQWQSTMLHVFASNEQKFGDTFFMHVPTFADRAEKKALLEWYDVNYVDQIVLRRPLPIIEHNEDSQVDAVKNTDWPGPLALFTTNGLPITIPAVPLWRSETKTIVSLSAGASSVIVPVQAKGSVKTQLYDYPYIDKTMSKRHSDLPLDIVFISNGEREADWLYTWLEGRIAGLEPNRLVRVDGVKGRVAAYQAAARASRTPWFFAVFGKLQVDLGFEWSWQPDRMQQPKHYIFHAKNPINGLVYGHQAMIAYNRKLVLENTGQGLDFTLDQPHEVVPILSGVANYHTSNWMCWRTAFRECIKLRASLPDVENEYRLNQWLTVDTGAGQWSSKGAQDAVEYYDEVGGDFEALKKSYEWDWLASYAFMKRSLLTDR